MNEHLCTRPAAARRRAYALAGFAAGVVCLTGGAKADPAADVQAAYQEIATQPRGDGRNRALADLAQLAETHTQALAWRLQKPTFVSSAAERRALFESLGFLVPDDQGRFRYPSRPTREETERPEPDWLAILAEQPSSSPALAESLQAVATIRALATSQDPLAADAILLFAFADEGMVFRDECGRYLRKMDPYSLPALLKYSAKRSRRDNPALARYAAYQLDVLKKGRPSYALMAAPTDELEALLLKTLGEVHHPDAVSAVLERANSPRRAIRVAARAAWMEYVTGPEPPPAPKAKRKLLGGDLSDEPVPLYLNYREFAREELVRLYEKLFAKRASSRWSAEDLTHLVFQRWDEERFARGATLLDEAKAAADRGDLAAMAAKYDQLLVEEPAHPRRAEAVPGYVQFGKKLADEGQLEGAASAFNKALSLSPPGDAADQVAAQLLAVRAKIAETSNQDSDRALRAALLSDPSHPGVRAARRGAMRQERAWLLYLGAVLTGLALLGGLALLLRRHRAQKQGGRSWGGAG